MRNYVYMHMGIKVILQDECVDQKCLVTLIIIMWLLRNVENIQLQGYVPERYLHETIPTVDQKIGRAHV